jgi:MFS family permease
MLKKWKLFRQIDPTVLLLSFVSFLNDIGGEMILAILPMFMMSLGATGIIVGFISGCRDSLASLLEIVSGYWADKTGKRKIWVFTGYFVGAIFKFLLAFSRVWLQILFFSSMERVGKGLRTAPRDALVADAMPQDKGRGFGVHRAFDTLGALVGSSFVLFLFWFWHLSFKSLIMIAGVIAFFALIPLASVKEPHHNPRHIHFKMGWNLLSRDSKFFLLITSLFAFANFSYMFFILKAQTCFTGELSIRLPILLYMLFNLFYATFSIPSGILSDKIGRKTLLLIGYGLFGIVTIGFALTHSLWVLAGLFALYGIVYAIVEVNQRAYISDLSYQETQATALGTLHTTTGFLALPASLIAGALWQYAGSAVTFLYASVLSVLTVVLFLLVPKKGENKYNPVNI